MTKQDEYTTPPPPGFVERVRQVRNEMQTLVSKIVTAGLVCDGFRRDAIIIRDRLTIILAAAPPAEPVVPWECSVCGDKRYELKAYNVCLWCRAKLISVEPMVPMSVVDDGLAYAFNRGIEDMNVHGVSTEISIINFKKRIDHILAPYRKGDK